MRPLPYLGNRSHKGRLELRLQYFSDNWKSVSLFLYISRDEVSNIYSTCTQEHKEVIGCARNPGEWLNLSITQTNTTLEIFCNNNTILMLGTKCGESFQYPMTYVTLYGEILEGELYEVLYSQQGLQSVHRRDFIQIVP